MRFKRQSHITDLLFTLSLFCVFAASSLIVVIIGANVYRGTVDQMNENFDTRASLTYVSTKIRQNDSAGSVALDEIEGVPALVLSSKIEGYIFKTWIYHHDGALREVFAGALSTVALADGQVIVEVERFTVEQEENGLLRLTAMSADDDGTEYPVSVLINPRAAA